MTCAFLLPKIRLKEWLSLIEIELQLCSTWSTSSFFCAIFKNWKLEKVVDISYGLVQGEGFLISSMSPAMFFKKRLCIFFSSISRNFIVGRRGAAAGAAILWGTRWRGWPQNMLSGFWNFLDKCVIFLYPILLILIFIYLLNMPNWLVACKCDNI